MILLFACHIIKAQDQTVLDSLKNELSDKKDTTQLLVRNELFWKLIYTDPAEARKYLDESMPVAIELNDSSFIAALINNFGVYYWSQSDFAQSLASFKQSLEIFERLGKKNRVSATLNNIGNIYDELGDYESALDYQLRALRLKEELGLSERNIANSYINIGNIHVEMDNDSLALVYYNRSVSMMAALGDSAFVAEGQMNIASVKRNLGQDREAISMYKSALKYFRKHNQSYDIASSLDGLGQEYFSIGELDSALACYQESSQLNTEFGNEDLLSLNYRNIGEIYAEKGNYTAAISFLLKGLAISERLETQKELVHDYRVLSKTYKKMGDYKRALEFHEKYLDQQFDVFDSDKDKAISELQIKYETEKKESEIAIQNEQIKILRQEAEISELRRTLLISGIIGLIIIGALVIYSFSQKMKRVNIEKEQEKAGYEKELNFRKKELTTHTLHLVQKNELLEELKDKLTLISKSATENKRELNRIVQIIKNDSVAEKDWENFKMYFEQVHEDFDLKLRERFNDLTSNEMRLAALMKMNLTTKEMANILNISPDSVNKARYRLRKKLKLGTDDSLTDFILAL